MSLLTARFLRRWPLPAVDPGGNKDSRGAVMIVGGSPQMPGAVVLAATAALRAGAGKLQIATAEERRAPRRLASSGGAGDRASGDARRRAIASCCAEIVKRAEGLSAVLLGPGMVDTRAACRLSVELCGRLEDLVLVLDAEALESCSAEPSSVAASKAKIAITPHAKEMAHVLRIEPSEVQREPARMALKAAGSAAGGGRVEGCGDVHCES